MLNTITLAYTTLMSVERSFIAGKVFKTHGNDFKKLHKYAAPYYSLIGTHDTT